MQLTIRGELVQLAEEDKQAIGGLMRTYSSCKRFVFNRDPQKSLITWESRLGE